MFHSSGLNLSSYQKVNATFSKIRVLNFLWIKTSPKGGGLSTPRNPCVGCDPEETPRWSYTRGYTVETTRWYWLFFFSEKILYFLALAHFQKKPFSKKIKDVWVSGWSGVYKETWVLFNIYIKMYILIFIIFF